MENRIGGNKSYRLLSLYECLIRGEKPTKQYLADLYNVDKRSIQRDIADLNEYLFEEGRNQEIQYNSKLKAYELHRKQEGAFSDHDIYAVSKILLESRAFSDKEMNRLLDTLLMGAIDQNTVRELLKNERFHYAEPRHGREIIDFIWLISQSIKNHQRAQILYVRQDGVERSYTIEPLGLIFSEYYFYLIARRVGDIHQQATIFRIDRFKKYKVLDEFFQIPYADRFQEGEFHKRIQFMYTGPLTTITFSFWGASLEAVLDRLPTARVIEQNGERAVVRAEVYGEGVKRWLLSQMQYLEVLSPESYREDMKQTIDAMAACYRD
ncbi:MAG: helix-turn-helix transcriptional regulator [Eubacteriaceae bacterium]